MNRLETKCVKQENLSVQYRTEHTTKETAVKAMPQTHMARKWYAWVPSFASIAAPAAMSARPATAHRQPPMNASVGLNARPWREKPEKQWSASPSSNAAAVSEVAFGCRERHLSNAFEWFSVEFLECCADGALESFLECLWGVGGIGRTWAMAWGEEWSALVVELSCGYWSVERWRSFAIHHFQSVEKIRKVCNKIFFV